jgi:hypothetical protein
MLFRAAPILAGIGFIEGRRLIPPILNRYLGSGRLN